MEIWKPIKGYEGIYEVSSYGRVRSLEHKAQHKSRTGNEFQVNYKGRIRTEAETMKDKGNSNLWEYRHPYNKEHEGEEYTEGKVIQQQNEQIETLSRSVSELKDEMETMRRRHAIHVTDIYARTLWQRILNKTVEP